MTRISSFFQSDPSTAFLRAARAGQLEKVLEYLESGVDINASNAVSYRSAASCRFWHSAQPRFCLSLEKETP